MRLRRRCVLLQCVAVYAYQQWRDGVQGRKEAQHSRRLVQAPIETGRGDQLIQLQPVTVQKLFVCSCGSQ